MIDSRIETPEQALATAFAEHVLVWVGEKNQGILDTDVAGVLYKAAYLVSLAVSAGDACVLLDLVEDPARGWDKAYIRNRLLESGVVGTDDAPDAMPLIVDGEDRLYLHRYFEYECFLAERLCQMKAARTVDVKLIRFMLDSLFGIAKSAGGVDWQKLAVAMALRQSLLIISGGPGTGKTTTVANLLACLLEAEPENRIVLAAPTGKAAMRMLEAIRQHADAFPLYVQPLVPGEAYTLHRLLGTTPDPAVFRHHAGNPLPLDTLVVDEASMLDLAMASRLFAALPRHARVILLGDKDQLAAVEAGAVFSELSAQFALSRDCIKDLAALTGIERKQMLMSQEDTDAVRYPLENSVVWFSRNYRFSETSGIGKLASDIRDRRIDEAINFLCSGTDASVIWLDLKDPAVMVSFHERVLASCRAYFDCVRKNPADRPAIFEAFNRSRILCAVRDGPFGVETVNRLVVAAASGLPVSRHACEKRRNEWFLGKPVMVLKNDYAMKLFNGDIGLVLPDDTGQLSVCFMMEDGSFRFVSPMRIPEYETAYAMTVHKSQGSEFDSVFLLLPSVYSRVLTRELLYTGITRARSQITVAGSGAVLKESLESGSPRCSGLTARLKAFSAIRV